MQIKGKSDKKCVRCDSKETRAVTVTNEFVGSLCKEHIWELTDHPVVKKPGNSKKKEQKGGTANAQTK
jgi:hypothetical protein